MSSTTLFLSRLLGLYCILASLSLVVHKQASLSTVNMLVHNPPVVLLLGVITLAAGLAIVLGHNVWSGGLLPVIVTVVGWITLIKGLLFVFLTPDAIANLLEAMQYNQRFYLYAGVSILIGIYLSYSGFKKPRKPAP